MRQCWDTIEFSTVRYVHSTVHDGGIPDANKTARSDHSLGRSLACTAEPSLLTAHRAKDSDGTRSKGQPAGGCCRRSVLQGAVIRTLCAFLHLQHAPAVPPGPVGFCPHSSSPLLDIALSYSIWRPPAAPIVPASLSLGRNDPSSAHPLEDYTVLCIIREKDHRSTRDRQQ